jgi:hypothetical protein
LIRIDIFIPPEVNHNYQKKKKKKKKKPDLATSCTHENTIAFDACAN